MGSCFVFSEFMEVQAMSRKMQLYGSSVRLTPVFLFTDVYLMARKMKLEGKQVQMTCVELYVKVFVVR